MQNICMAASQSRYMNIQKFDISSPAIYMAALEIKQCLLHLHRIKNWTTTLTAIFQDDRSQESTQVYTLESGFGSVWIQFL